ncbi:ribosomal large subunit pseudouridine synthase B [Synechococcus sp. CC9902]|uniref:pseudouridine synthase n=1 Tax=Synechococcus sp. (strain CC9902) TaxID=316279 RepID=UPI00005D41E9|nr:pseudouridine synthase [Synechococcus sp. CC9902]ABB26341.1 ribosomal large subunit pseudouridine synthase B [Synechococcus sp. CC9902]
MTRQRLQKLMAAAGLCSRRRGEDWLQAGRVTVDGRVASLGDQADPNSQLIEVDGVPLISVQEPRVFLLNKPVGVICSCRDPQGRATVLDCLPHQERSGLHPVGRLDADSRGALLLTDQGELTLRLTHPRYNHAKTYRVLVRGIPSSQALRRWRDGLLLDGRLTRPARVHCLRSRGASSLLEVELKEGRNRQIRRVAELLGHPVIDLQRVAIDGIRLDDLAEGCWRRLDAREWSTILVGNAPRSMDPS